MSQHSIIKARETPIALANSEDRSKRMAHDMTHTGNPLSHRTNIYKSTNSAYGETMDDGVTPMSALGSGLRRSGGR